MKFFHFQVSEGDARFLYRETPDTKESLSSLTPDQVMQKCFPKSKGYKEGRRLTVPAASVRTSGAQAVLLQLGIVEEDTVQSVVSTQWKHLVEGMKGHFDSAGVSCPSRWYGAKGEQGIWEEDVFYHVHSDKTVDVIRVEATKRVEQRKRADIALEAAATSAEMMSRNDFIKFLHKHRGKQLSDIAKEGGEKFRRRLIDQMFGSEVIQFTIDDDPFGSKNDILRFCVPLLTWLEGIGASRTEIQKYTEQIVRFYVIGDCLLDPPRDGGTVDFYDYRTLHEGNDPTKPIRKDYLDKTAKGKKKQDILNWLMEQGLSSDCFQFHEVVGHPKSSENGAEGKKPKHIIHYGSDAPPKAGEERKVSPEFQAKVTSFQTIIRTVTGDRDYRVRYMRTTGGGGMSMRRDGLGTFTDASLRFNAESMGIVPEYWGEETDTGREGGHMTLDELRSHFLKQHLNKKPFIPLMHFQHLKAFDTEFFDRLARDFVAQEFDAEVKASGIPEGTGPAIEATEKPTGTKTYTVTSEDNGLIPIGDKLGVDWREIARLNNMKAPYTIREGQQLTVPASANVEATESEDIGEVETSQKQGTYTVQRKDILSRIAQKYPGVSYRQIAAFNGLPDPDYIYPGQVLEIPKPSYRPTGGRERVLRENIHIRNASEARTQISRLRSVGVRLVSSHADKQNKIPANPSQWRDSMASKYDYSKEDGVTDGSGRTYMIGARMDTINGFIALVQAAKLGGKTLHVNGVAETVGHAKGKTSRSPSHYNGYKIDFWSNRLGGVDLINFIKKQDTKPRASSVGPIYEFTLGGYKYKIIYGGSHPNHADVAIWKV